MGTVTYKNQPGTAAVLKCGTPLAGTKHVYSVKKVLWPEEVESFLATLLIPESLHICSGKSMIGDVRLDNDPNTPQPFVHADAATLPFEDEAFASVLCDPPYNGQMQWNHDVLDEMARVARERIIFQHWFMPISPDGHFKKWKERWQLEEVYVWQPRTYFGRVQVISVLGRCDAGRERGSTGEKS